MEKEENEIDEIHNEGKIDYFIQSIISVGGKSLGITIPKRNVDFSGLEVGQTLKWYYKVIEKPKVK